MIWVAYIAGFGFALLAGPLLIKPTVDLMWRRLGWRGEGDDEFRADTWQPPLTGHLERVLYISSLLACYSSFIGFWLALKAASQWRRWGEQTPLDDGRIIRGRSVFQVFLFGSGLSVLFATVGYGIILWIKSSQWFYLGIVPLALILGTLFTLWQLRQ